MVLQLFQKLMKHMNEYVVFESKAFIIAAICWLKKLAGVSRIPLVGQKDGGCPLVGW